MLLGVCFSCNSYLDLKPYGETIPKTPEEFSALLHSILNDIDYGTDRITLGIAVLYWIMRVMPIIWMPA